MANTLIGKIALVNRADRAALAPPSSGASERCARPSPFPMPYRRIREVARRRGREGRWTALAIQADSAMPPRERCRGTGRRPLRGLDFLSTMPEFLIGGSWMITASPISTT